MRTCREITALVSKGLDTSLRLHERVAVWLHVTMCSRCHNFQKQATFIRKAAKQYTDNLSKKS